ncbi:MAG: MarR family winged helix-turn-helix transcriptional regulator [Anaerovoracaceae bacterium]
MDTTKRQITKIAREANKLVIRTMKDDGIGSGEMDLIHLVRHNPGISQKEACLQLNMDKGAVARRTASLEQKGYLTRKENPADGRSQLLYATEKAESLKTSKAAVEAVFYGWLLEGLEEAEQAAFTETLQKLYLRSKQESRSGFPHVTARITGEPGGCGENGGEENA